MSTLRAPVPCERCASPETQVQRVVVEYKPNLLGKLVQDAALYYVRCLQCEHEFQATVSSDAELA